LQERYQAQKGKTVDEIVATAFRLAKGDTQSINVSCDVEVNSKLID